MNTTWTASIIILGLFWATSASTIKNAYIQDITKANVSGVTIYRSYAEIQLDVPLKIGAGRTEVLLTNVPYHTMLPGTFRVSSTKGQVTSHSLGMRKIPGTGFSQDRLNEYEESLKKLVSDLKSTSLLLQNAGEQQSTLRDLIKSRGDKAPTSEEISALVDLIANRGAVIAKEIAELDSKKSELTKQKEDLEAKIKSEKAKKNDIEDYVISVILSLDPQQNQGEVTDEVIRIQYLANTARWNSSYILNYNAEDGTARLEYFAEITQFTGFDFDNVPITLATAQFMEVARVPELSSIQIEIAPKTFSTSSNIIDSYIKPKTQSYSYNTNKMQQNYYGKSFRQSADFSDQERAMDAAMEFLEVAEDSVEVEDKFVSATFQLNQKLFIPSTSVVPSRVLISSVPLKLNVRHYAIPKLSTHAYLRGYTANPSKLVLLRGPMSVYIDGSYVTKTFLTKDVQPEAKFNVLLGVDEGIEISYKSETKFKDTEGFIQSFVNQHANLHITAINNKQEDITIWIYDQLPKSTDEKITVTLIEPNQDKAVKVSNDSEHDVKDLPAFSINTQSQAVRWIETLKPGQAKHLPFHFKVTYPEKQHIIVNEGNKL